MKALKSALIGATLLFAAATAQRAERAVHPDERLLGRSVRPGGSGIFGGFIDYVNMVNARDGGVNGVKLTYEKCETEYNNARGVECYERQKKKGPTGATLIHPLSTGITYSLIDKAPPTRSRSCRSATAAPTPPTAACSPTSSR